MQPDLLITQLQDKNEKAFRRIYEMYSENVLGIIQTIVRDAELAEEVMQDVFIKVWNNATSYDASKGRFFTWILNIARNAAIDKTRSKAYKNKKQNHQASFFVDILEAKDSFVAKVDAIGIKKYIGKLKPVCKEIIELIFFKGYTHKETAEALTMPLGTVKTRNRNCIKELRAALNLT
ncbi:sigma-70 family RNA polymerase sigma factor [Gangjinia marincola]|uniref:Sigma-70 family RNA polymerase sigma factor n=1 Tax=Gangjinia marincola TaxID=578463 RepID=A0ABN1MJ61_9FLAO